MYVRGRWAAQHVTPRRSGFSPGWPKPQLPRPLPTAAAVMSRRVEGVEVGIPHTLAQGNESIDGRTGRAQEGRAWSRELTKGVPGWVVARGSRWQLLRDRKEAENGGKERKRKRGREARKERGRKERQEKCSEIARLREPVISTDSRAS